MAEKAVAWKYLGLSEKFDYLKSHKSDCNLIVGSVPEKAQIFEAHVFILKSVSEVFERMFNRVFQSKFHSISTSNEIKIIDVEPCDFKPFLEFIYYNNGDIKYCPIPTWINLIYLGKKYMMKELVDICHSFIKNGLDFNSTILSCNDLIHIFEYAQQQSVSDLIALCNELIKRKYQEFRSEQILQLSCIFDLNSSVFFNLMVVIRGQVTHLIMFKLIETYAKLNSLETTISSNESNDINLVMMLNLIDYREMSVKEFWTGPAQSKTIKMELFEKYDMLVYLCKKAKLI